MRRLAKSVAMITGAAVGVGKAFADAHAREGALAVRTHGRNHSPIDTAGDGDGANRMN